MTQPAEAAVLDTAAQDTSVHQPQAVPTKPLTPKELADEIKQEADVQMADLRKLMRFQWGDTAWEWGKPAPVNAAYTIMAMFHSESSEEVRAYGAPAKPGPYVCYILRKDAPSYGVETMSLATFRESVVDELNALESEMSPRDIGRAEGREECVEYLRNLAKNGGIDAATGAALTLEQIAQKLDDEADVEDDGGDEEGVS